MYCGPKITPGSKVRSPLTKGKLARCQRALRGAIEALETRRLLSGGIQVTDTSDSATDTGSLRYAIAQANADATPSDTYTITFAPALAGQTIASGSTLELSNTTSGVKIVIDASAAPGLTVKGGGSSSNFSVFTIDSGTNAAIDNLTITGGQNSLGRGGGISNSGMLTVQDSTLSGNSASSGGGISNNNPDFNNGVKLTVQDSTLSGNSAEAGGGIANQGGTLMVQDSTLNGNSADYTGGGIANAGGPLTVQDSTVSGNSAGYGGGIFIESGSVTLQDITLSGNSAGGGGGFDNNAGSVTLQDSTLSGNSATSGGGIRNYSVLTVQDSTLSGNSASSGGGIENFIQLTIQDSIVAGNTASNGPDYHASNESVFTDLGHNLLGTGFTPTASDVSSDTPDLAPLGYYGGPTQTQGLLPGSPAIGKGAPATDPTTSTTITTDQRGFTLPASNSDIGAFQSGPLVVNTPADPGRISGDLSLREAVNLANAYATAGDPATITFASALAGDTITLTSGVIELSGTPATGSALITIDGGGDITVSGDNASTVFKVDSGVDAEIENLTIISGKGSSGYGASGGGIYNAGMLTVNNSTLSGNTAGFSGGGIYNAGSMTVQDSTLSGNYAYSGGGIENYEGTLTVQDSTLSGNSAADGGGITNDGTLTVQDTTLSGNSAGSAGGIFNVGVLKLQDSTLSGNSSVDHGGGIYNSFGTLTVQDSTLSGNSAGDFGGGIYNYQSTLTVQDGTLTGNSAERSGGGIYNYDSVLSAQDSILSANTAATGPDVLTSGSGTFNDLGNNLLGTALKPAGTVTNGDVFSDTPGLAPLANNGGPTQTMALHPGSPAIAAGVTADYAGTTTPITTDQRGLIRPASKPDIGAFQTPGSYTITVNDNADRLDNPAGDFPNQLGSNITLRDAINAANNAQGTTTIVLADTIYDFTTADNNWYGPNDLPAVDSNITIQGNGATLQRDTACQPDTAEAMRFFYVSGGIPTELPLGTLTLQNLTMTNGLAKGGNSYNGGGGLGAGGAIFNQGNLLLSGVTLSGNTAMGGTADSSQADDEDQGGGGLGQDGFSGDPTGGGGFGGSFPVGKYGGQAANGGGFANNSGGGMSGLGGGGGGDGSGNFGGGGDNGGGGGVGGGGGGSVEFNGGAGGFGGGGGEGGDLGGVGGNGGFGAGGGDNGGSGGFDGGNGNGGYGQGGGGAGLGGAIFSMYGSVTVVNSTLTANTAQGGTGANGGSADGAAIFNLDGTVSLTFATVANNTVTAGTGTSAGSANGGALYNLAYGNNYKTGAAETATATLGNSILSGSTNGTSAVNDLVNSAVNGKNTNTATVGNTAPNVVVMASGATTTQTAALASVTNANLGLAPLGSYGGLTQTMALLPGSPAIGAGTPITGITTDQTGFTRSTTAPSLGAYENEGFTIKSTGGTPQSTPVSTAFGAALSVQVLSNNDLLGSFAGGTITFTAPAQTSASATFSTNPITLAANGTGSASATANTLAGGPYNVTAGASGIATPATFALSNTTTGDSISGTDYLASSTTTAGSLTTSTTGTPIGDTIIKLTGTDDTGAAVSITTATAANGAFSFAGLNASNSSGYTLTETPPSTDTHLGQTSTTSGATTNTPPGTPAVVSSIVLANAVTSSTDNFFETPATATVGQYTGTPSANTSSSYNNLGNTYLNVFDGNTNTFFDSPSANGNYVQLDLGSAKTITQIAFAPRVGFESRMIGGAFEASNSSTFASGVVTLIPALTAAPADGLTTVAVSPGAQYEYIRYVAPAGSYGNIAELQVFGPGGATPPASTSTELTGTYSASTTDSYDHKTSDNFMAVFDNNTNTYWDSPNPSGNWVQIDLGASPSSLTQLDFAPRPGFESRMIGGVFEASNSSSFSTFTTLYTVSQTPQDGLTTVPISGTFEFIRYVAPDSSYGNIAEMELFGPGETTAPAPAPPPPATVVELSGTASGTAGSYDSKTSDNYTAAFDGSLSTFFDAPTAGTSANPNYVEFTLPEAESITQLKFAPRVGFEYRMMGGVFQVSTSSTFASGSTVTVDTLTQAPSDGLTTIPVSGSYQYIRYIAPANAYGNIAELQVYGIPGTAAPTSPPSTPTSSQLTNGNTYSGTAGSYQNNGDTFANAFDGSTSTFFDAPSAGTTNSPNYVQISLPSAKTITSLAFAPRAGYEYRMAGGYFEASNDANFGANDTTTLYTISGTPSPGLTTITFPFPGSYQYVRYIAPAGSYGNIAELQLFGY